MPDLLDLRPEPSALRPPEEGMYEMDDSVGDGLSRTGSRQTLSNPPAGQMPSAESKVEAGVAKGMARHTLGLLLLLCVVFLWTLSNFLGSVSCTALSHGEMLLRNVFAPALTDSIYRASLQMARMTSQPSSHGSTARHSCSPWFRI
jgi:hypothetical protein